MTTKHTPGPWHCSCGGGDVIGNSRVVATMAWCSGFGPEDEANASLVAAAPDMLAALILAADYIKDLDGGNQHSETGWMSDELLSVWLTARAAIAKATGQNDDRTDGTGSGVVHARANRQEVD